jgi:hypothetical protein
MNTNNSMNIQKNSKSFLGLPHWDKEMLFDEKTGANKSRNTVPLINLRYFNHMTVGRGALAASRAMHHFLASCCGLMY